MVVFYMQTVWRMQQAAPRATTGEPARAARRGPMVEYTTAAGCHEHGEGSAHDLLRVSAIRGLEAAGNLGAVNATGLQDAANDHLFEALAPLSSTRNLTLCGFR
jgi:hypothetical protein